MIMSNTTMETSSLNEKCLESMYNGRRVSMTTCDLVSAANCSFALHQREESTASSSSSVPNPLKDCATSSHSFNLRKRTIDDKPAVVMASYNSAFLSGLFADIAKANSESTTSVSCQDEDPRLDPSKSIKKSRSTMSRSISRCGKSFCDLNSISPPKTPTNFSTSATVSPDQECTRRFLSPQGSASGEIHCVSSASSNESESCFLGKLAFPQLPATISNPSCNVEVTLTRKVSFSQPPLDAEKTKESYGWFVEMDDEVQTLPPKTDPFKTSSPDLAFVAATAPKSVNYDAEVEWAKAADTVDDVLGDFF